jgi:glyoxylase-like metal-dependent hydrolase (beta-lactamase superfamily II)
MPRSCIHYLEGIVAIDAQFVSCGRAAIYMIVEGGRAAFFDTGTNGSLPQVLAALTFFGIARECVDYVIPSHVHLDHAGGAGAMMAAFPNARLIVHPRGARHLAVPSRLIAGTREVYGDALTRARYGDPLPVPAARIVETADGMPLELAGRTLTVLDTPGHARHHVSILDERTRHVFAGDAFGFCLRLPAFADRDYAFPSTSPSQFDPVAMHASVDRILRTRPAAVCLTHFGRVTDVQRLGADLHRLIDAHCAVARAAAGGPAESRQARLHAGLRELFMEETARQRLSVADSSLLDLVDEALEVNAQGLAVWLDTGA